MGRPENVSWVSPTVLLCVVVLLQQGHVFAKTISLSTLRSSSTQQDTNLWDFDQIDEDGEGNFAVDDYALGHGSKGVSSLQRGNNGNEGEPSFDNSLGSYFYSMTTTPEESLRDELSPPSPLTFSHAASTSQLHPRLQYTGIGESFPVKSTVKAASHDATSSDSTREQKWALSPLDYLAIKQSRLRNSERQNYNKVNENEGTTERGSITQQEEQEAILSHTRSNGLGRFSSARDNSDDVGRNGAKGHQGKVESVFTSKNIKLETTPDFSAGSHPSSATTLSFDAPIPSVLIEVEKGRYDENQDMEGNPTTRITEPSESNTHTTTPFDLPYRVPFPYVSRGNNEDSYKKAEGKPQNTNDMTDPSQTLVNKAVTLLQRRNRSRRDIAESGITAQEHETELQLEQHQHNSNETAAAAESVDHSQVANVKNTTQPTSSNPLEALQRLTRLLEKMLRQLSQFRQKFTLRLIRMTEREDMDQMQEIMKDFDISGEKPIFFIAGGLRKLNVDTRTTTTSDLEKDAAQPSVLKETGQLIGGVEQQHSTTTIGPLPSLPETTILPVEPETEALETGSDMIIIRHNTTTTKNDPNVEQISSGNPSTTERLLSRHARSDLEMDQFGINSYTFPMIPGRSARTENPYDDEDHEEFYPYPDPSYNFDWRYDGDSDKNVGTVDAESITSLNFSPLHPIHQSHGERNDDVRLDEAISGDNPISITPNVEKASAAPIILPSAYYIPPTESIIPANDSITEENERSNDQDKNQAHAAGLNSINLVSPSPSLSSNIDQDNGAHDVLPNIPVSRNNEELTESNPENLNLAAQPLIEKEGGKLNPVNYSSLTRNPTLFASENQDSLNAGSTLKLLLDETLSTSRASSKEQAEKSLSFGMAANEKEDAELKVSSQKHVLAGNAEPVQTLYAETTIHKANILPGRLDTGNSVKVASPLSALPNERNEPNHETPRRLTMIEDSDENKKYNAEVLGTATKSELQSNVLSAGETKSEPIKGTLPTPELEVDMSLTSEGAPKLQRTLSSKTPAANQLISGEEISEDGAKPISPLISNNAPFPAKTELSFSGLANKLEKRPLDTIPVGDREAETDIRKKSFSLGESRQENLVAGESVGDMKKVGKNVEQQKIGKEMEVTLDETTFRSPTNLGKHQIMGNKTSSPLDKASNITFIQRTGIDTVDQSLMKQETDNHVRNAVVPSPPNKYFVVGFKGSENNDMTRSIVAPIVSNKGVTNPTVTNTLVLVETDKEKTAHPSVQPPTTQSELPDSQITSRETANVLKESLPEPILDGDVLLSSDGSSVVSTDKNIEGVPSEKHVDPEVVGPGAISMKVHTDADMVPPVQTENVEPVRIKNAISDTPNILKVAAPISVDTKPSENLELVEQKAISNGDLEKVNPLVSKKDADATVSENKVDLLNSALSVEKVDDSAPTADVAIDHPPIVLDPVAPTNDIVKVTPIVVPNHVVKVDPIAVQNDVVKVEPIAMPNDVVKVEPVAVPNDVVKVEPLAAPNDAVKVEPLAVPTDVVKIEPVLDAVKVEPLAEPIDVVKVNSVADVNVEPPADVVKVEPIAVANDVVKVEPIAVPNDVVKVEPVVPVNNVVKVEPVIPVNDVVKLEPIAVPNDVVKVDPVVSVNSVVKVEPVIPVNDVVKVEPIAVPNDVVKVEPVADVKVEPLADVVKVEPVIPVSSVVKVEPVIPVNDVVKVEPIAVPNDVVKVEPLADVMKVEPTPVPNDVMKVEPVADVKVEPLADVVKVEQVNPVSSVVKVEPVIPVNDVVKVEPIAVPNDVVKVEPLAVPNDVVKVEPLAVPTEVVKVEPLAVPNDVVKVKSVADVNVEPLADVVKVEPLADVVEVEPLADVVKVEPVIPVSSVVKVEPVIPVNDVVNVEPISPINDIVKIDPVLPVIPIDDVKVEPVVPANELVKVEPVLLVNPPVPMNEVTPLFPVHEVIKEEPVAISDVVKVEPVSTPELPITPVTPVDSAVKTVPEIPIVADNSVSVVPKLPAVPEAPVALPAASKTPVEIPVVPEAPVEIPAASKTPIEVPATQVAPNQPPAVVDNSPVVPLSSTLTQTGVAPGLSSVPNVVPSENLSSLPPEASAPVAALQPTLATGDEISIVSNIPQKNPDSSFGIKPIATKPHLQIPGLRPSVPERPHPEYLDFISQGVDAVSDVSPFVPAANGPVVVSSPPVHSGYSPTAILKRQQQLFQSFFSGLLFRKDSDV